MDEQQSSEVLPSENGRELSENYREEGREKSSHHHPQSGTTSFPGGFIGKHRLQAALTHLNNQISILQVKSTLFISSYFFCIKFSHFILTWKKNKKNLILNCDDYDDAGRIGKGWNIWWILHRLQGVSKTILYYVILHIRNNTVFWFNHSPSFHPLTV